jgi:hypothetical protein
MPRLAAIRLSSLALARQPSFASTSRCKRSPPAAALLSRLSRPPYAPPSLWPQGWPLQRGRSYDLPAATANYHGPRRYPVSPQCAVRTQCVPSERPSELLIASVLPATLLHPHTVTRHTSTLASRSLGCSYRARRHAAALRPRLLSPDALPDAAVSEADVQCPASALLPRVTDFISLGRWDPHTALHVPAPAEHVHGPPSP